MSSIEKAVTYSKKLENLLVQELQAEGRGLHEKVSSVETELPHKLVKQIRWIATLRNKVVHEEFTIEDIDDFEVSCNEAIESLKIIIENIKFQKKEAELAKLKERKQTDSGTVHPKTITIEKEILVNKSSLLLKSLLLLSLIINFILYVNLNTTLKDNNALKKENTSLSSQKHQAKKSMQELEKKLEKTETKLSKSRANYISLNKKYRDLSSKQNNVATKTPSKIRANDSTSVKVNKNSLLNLASKSKDEYQNAKNEIDSYFQDLSKNLKVTLGKVQMRSTRSGHVDLIYPVSWTINKSRLDKLMATHLVSGYDKKDSKTKSISRYNLNESTKPYAKDLFNYLGTKKISIRLSAGKYQSNLLIASGMRCHVSCRLGNRLDEYHIQYGNSNRVLDWNQSNPIEIKDIPESYLEKIADIKVEVILH